VIADIPTHELAFAEYDWTMRPTIGRWWCLKSEAGVSQWCIREGDMVEKWVGHSGIG